MEPIDVWRTAHQLMKMYGAEADLIAAQRADTLLDQGDTDGFHVWQRVTAAISDLRRDKPSASESIN